MGKKKANREKVHAVLLRLDPRFYARLKTECERLRGPYAPVGPFLQEMIREGLPASWEKLGLDGKKGKELDNGANTGSS